MKRIIPVFLVFVITLTCIISPVSADSFEFPELFYNVLDYASPNGFANNAVSLPDANGAITFEIPGEMKFNYVDIFVSSSSRITSAVINGTSLKVLDTYNNTFRIYGNIPSALYSDLVLNLITSSSSVVTFFSFNAYSEGVNHREIIGGLKVNYDNSIVYNEVQSSAGASLSYTYPIESDSGLVTSNLYLSCGSWMYHDYIAFRFRSNMTITNIVGMTEAGDFNFPVYVSNYNDVAATNDSTLYFCIMDVRSLPRNLPADNNPILYVRGYRQGNRATSAQLYDTIGYSVTNTGDPVLHFIRKLSSNLEDWFSDLKTGLVTALDNVQFQLKSSISAFRQEVYQLLTSIKVSLSKLVLGQDYEEDADSFNESVSDQSQELEDMTSIMGSVEKPDINNIDFNPCTMVDTNTLVLATSGLSNVLGNQIIIRILLMALTFALVGFVLYGKK